MMRLAILGGGRAAWAYGSEWRKIGWPIAGVWLRDESTSRIAELLQTGRRSIDALAKDADLILVAVAHSAIANWRAHRGRARFTGPAARGDSEVIERHIRALGDDPQLARIYELLANEITGSDPCEG